MPRFAASLSPAELTTLAFDWPLWARSDQWPPMPGWLVWLVMGGRGAGKTRTGAEWVRGLVMGREPFARVPGGRIALIGETAADVREVMIEGPSGLLAIHPRAERPVWTASRRRLEWPNGAVAQAFSAEEPDSLRGPQFSAAWLDELAKWRHADAVFDMLQFGLRLGEAPRQIITTTPRPMPLLKKLIGTPTTRISTATTRANIDHLAPGFVAGIEKLYGGTRMGRQELLGEIIEDRPDALWSRRMLDAARVTTAAQLERIVVAVDPPAGLRGDACGLIAAGRGVNGIVYVLEDATVSGLTPHGWAMQAMALWQRHGADALVAEVNQGGEMVRAVLAQVAPDVPITTVRATRGKWLRAEPVAALTEQGRVCFVGTFPALEDEMCAFGRDGLADGHSPDRLDAFVWAVTALADFSPLQARVRVI